MSVQLIEAAFKERVCEKLSLAPEGLNRYRVLTPFLFDDGDHLAIVLKQDHGQWILSDEGNTCMRLTYDLDERELQKGNRHRIIENALAAFSVEDQQGELIARIEDDQYGDALYSFIQALLKISDVTFLTRELVRSTFMEDFRAFIQEKLPSTQYTFDWHDPVRDPEGQYAVDCRVNGRARPLFLYALPSNDKVRDATISLWRYETWRVPCRSVGVFEEQEAINRRVLARFSDVCDKQFSSLLAFSERLERYLAESD